MRCSSVTRFFPMPRGRTFLPWLLLLSLWASNAQAQNAPNFSAAPTLESGTALQQGAIYRFANVIPGIDARITLATFTGNPTLETLDNNTVFPERLQPVIRCVSAVNTTCWIRFDIRFVTAGTNTSASLRTVFMSAQDVDSSDGAANATTGIREFVEFGIATPPGGTQPTVTVANPTSLVAAAALVGGTRYIQGTGNNVQAGIGTDNTYEIYARYNDPVSAITIVGGATQGTTACNAATTNSCNRLNSYTFTPAEANVPSLTARKVSNGGVGTFAFTGTNGFDATSITTTVSGTGVSAQSQPLDTPGVATTLTEATPPAGFRLTGITCTGLSAGGTATPNIPGNGSAGGSVTLNAAATALVAGVPPSIVCEFTNALQPTVTVTKVSNGGVGTFAFSGTNGFAAQNITTVTPGTGVAGATQTLTAASTATTITEAAPPAGFALTAIACTGLGTGGTATNTINGTAGGSVALSAAATATGSAINCTFTNTRLGTIVIVKDAVPNDPQDFAFASTEAPLGNFSLDDDADATLPNTRTFSNLSPGTFSVTEAVTAGWTLSGLTCVDPDSGSTTSTATRTAAIDLDAGETITCTFTNTSAQADLQIAKSNGTTSSASGSTTTYTLTVTNNGPASVTGAAVRDTPGAGIACPATNPVTCSPAGACPAGTTVANLTSAAGVILGTIANGGVVTLSFACTVQ